MHALFDSMAISVSTALAVFVLVHFPVSFRFSVQVLLLLANFSPGHRVALATLRFFDV